MRVPRCGSRVVRLLRMVRGSLARHLIAFGYELDPHASGRSRMRAGSLPSAHRCCDHGSIGVAVGYCEGLHCGQRVMVPAHATPVSRSATVSNVSASLWHVLHGCVLMLPGDSSRRSVSSIATVA